MKNLDLYLEFRKELDKICVPEILKCMETKKIKVEGEVVGMLCACYEPYWIYIDCLYIAPEHRKKGLAKEAVLEWYKRQSAKDIRLRIINENKGAYKFWTNLFELEKLESNRIDTLYRIKELKNNES